LLLFFPRNPPPPYDVINDRSLNIGFMMLILVLVILHNNGLRHAQTSWGISFPFEVFEGTTELTLLYTLRCGLLGII
jgi:hypothetical protein